MVNNSLQHPGPDTVLRRYMPLWQLEDLVQSTELYCRRLDQFADLLDGMPAQAGNNQSDPWLKGIRHAVDGQIWISSWTRFASPGMAQWQEFSAGDEHNYVAVVTTAGALCKAIRDQRPWQLVAVSYHASGHWPSDADALVGASARDAAWANEQEVRLLSYADRFSTSGTGHGTRRLSVALRTMIEQIEVSPLANPGLNGQARQLLSSSGLSDVPVWQSRYLQPADC